MEEKCKGIKISVYNATRQTFYKHSYYMMKEIDFNNFIHTS